MHLLPTEAELTGHWVLQGKAVIGDATCLRIEWLINGRLDRVAGAGGGWEQLYQDPADGRYWELTYPQSHMHGGGPPSLGVLSAAQAQTKYQWPPPDLPAV